MIGSALIAWAVGLAVIGALALTAAALLALDVILQDHRAKQPTPLEAVATAGAPDLYDQAEDEDFPLPARLWHPATHAAIRQAITVTQPSAPAVAYGLHVVGGQR